MRFEMHSEIKMRRNLFFQRRYKMSIEKDAAV